MGIMNQVSRMFKGNSDAQCTEQVAPATPVAEHAPIIEVATVTPPAPEAPKAEPTPEPVAEAAPNPPPPASTSSDRLDMELSAKFDIFESGSTPPTNRDNANSSASMSNNSSDLAARVAELETRLSLMTESHAVAIKERDAADEGRRKLEKTLSEFLTRFASVRETQSAAFKEVEKLQDSRRELEKRNEELMAQLTKADENRVKATKDLEQRVLDLNAQLAGTEEAWNKVKKERDDLQARVDKQEQEVAQARAELNKFREMAVASLEPLGVDHNRMMKKLYSEADAMMTQMLQARDEAAQKYEAMCKMADELKANITSSRKELSQKFSMVIGGPAGESGTRPAIAAVPPATAPDSAPSAAPVAMAS